MDDDLINDELIDDIISRIVAEGMGVEDVDSYLTSEGVPDDLKEDIKETMREVLQAEQLADENTTSPEDMAADDNTAVTIAEEDTDGDGDPDKIMYEKDEPEDDSDDDSSPHDMNIVSDSSMKNILSTLASRRW